MDLLQSVAPAANKSRWRHVPAVLLVIALALLAIALAAPTPDIRIPRNRAVVMLVIDVTESMMRRFNGSPTSPAVRRSTRAASLS